MENFKYMNENLTPNPMGMNMAQPMPNVRGNNQLVYPEVFYQIQPFIILVCDQLGVHGGYTPSQEMVEQMTDSVYYDVCRMYPDLADRDYREAFKSDPSDPPFIGNFGFGMRNRMHPYDRDFGHDFFGRRFRRRGSLQDLISILLLSEIFNRRRMFL